MQRITVTVRGAPGVHPCGVRLEFDAHDKEAKITVTEGTAPPVTVQRRFLHMGLVDAVHDLAFVAQESQRFARLPPTAQAALNDLGDDTPLEIEDSTEGTKAP